MIWSPDSGTNGVVFRRLAPVCSLLLPTALAGLAAAAEPAAATDANVEPGDGEPIDLSGAQPAVVEPVEEPSWLTAPSERRCGFTVGLQLGAIIGAASGYPNDALKIDRDAYLTETGTSVGGMGSLWLGIALTDWFGVGLGMGSGSMTGPDHRTSFSSFGFHIDAYPAFAAGGAWRDLGLGLEAGLGVMETTPSDDEDTKLIESGVASRLAAGVFWEGLRPWKLGMGPYAMVDMMWGPPGVRPAGWFGWRMSFYAGP